jgi:hypothetical protein
MRDGARSQHVGDDLFRVRNPHLPRHEQRQQLIAGGGERATLIGEGAERSCRRPSALLELLDRRYSYTMG